MKYGVEEKGRIRPKAWGTALLFWGKDTQETQMWFGHIKAEMPTRRSTSRPRLPFPPLLYTLSLSSNRQSSRQSRRVDKDSGLFHRSTLPP